jgi:hypothetical protein
MAVAEPRPHNPKKGWGTGPAEQFAYAGSSRGCATISGATALIGGDSEVQ